MFRWIKSKFGIYENDYEYWFPIDDITISDEFKSTYPSQKKYRSKERTYLKYGVLSPIKINRNFILVDGYISYLLLQKYGCGKIPVYFVE